MYLFSPKYYVNLKYLCCETLPFCICDIC